MEIEDRVVWVLSHLLQQFLDTIRFGGESSVGVPRCRESGVKIDTIQLINSKCIWGQNRVLHNRIHPPRFCTDVACVEYRFAIALDQEHDRANTMIRINERHADGFAWCQLNDGRCLQRKRLGQLAHAFVGDITALEDTQCEIGSTVKFLQT
jgi:hypothetical protein